MKKIGFVDYYLSEWHANNYPAWIADACAALGVEYTVAYAWAELEVSPIDGVTTAQWCEKNGVKKCDTIDELCQKSDVILVLAPSNPEKHLAYAEAVLKHGKRTYIDKTFAPDYKTALEIFAIAQRYGAPFFSSSALRYAEELDAVETPRQMIVTGGGSNLPEYFIHMAEMAVKKLGTGIKGVTAIPHGSQWMITADYGDGRLATMIYGKKMRYTAYMASEEKEAWTEVKSAFFPALLKDILNFFETGEISFDTEETKEVIRLCEMAIRAAEMPSNTVEA